MLSRAAKLSVLALIVLALMILARPRQAVAQVLPPPAGAPYAAAPPADDVPLGKFRFHSFGAADGLRNLVVVAIVQDGDGMLWVATDDGVYRYDGQQFTHFSMQDGLPAMGVRVLGVAPDGA